MLRASRETCEKVDNYWSIELHLTIISLTYTRVEI